MTTDAKSDLVTVRSNNVSLSPEHQLVLKQVWTHLFHYWNIPVDGSAAFEKDELSSLSSLSIGETVNESKPPSLTKKPSLFGRFSSSSRSVSVNSTSHTNSSTKESTDTSGKSYEAGKIHDALSELPYPSDVIYQDFWNTLRLESPDNNLLRFVRARKYNVNKSIKMLARNFKFRHKRQVDEILNSGEYTIFKDQKKEGVMKNFQLQKTTIMGYDRKERPVILVRPKVHYSSEQTEEEIEEYSLMVIETSRLLMKEGSISILFDLTDFSLSNMDYPPVKFLITCFEAHYPESLGSLFIHKAPWLFSPIWSIIKNWLDPVVASKIVFTKNIKELTKFIDADQIPKYLDGKNDSFDYSEYTIPDGSHDTKMNMEEKSNKDAKEELLAKRNELIKEFQDVTIKWIQTSDNVESSRLWTMKCELGQELCQNYSELDPYIRHRSSYDISGILTV